MSKSVKYIGGVGSRYAQALSKTGIRTIEQLLEQGADRNGRLRISKLSSINESKILKWVHTCDLFRVKGIAGQYSDLLVLAGVHCDSCLEGALRCSPPNTITGEFLRTLRVWGAIIDMPHRSLLQDFKRKGGA